MDMLKDELTRHGATSNESAAMVRLIDWGNRLKTLSTLTGNAKDLAKLKYRHADLVLLKRLGVDGYGIMWQFKDEETPYAHWIGNANGDKVQRVDLTRFKEIVSLEAYKPLFVHK